MSLLQSSVHSVSVNNLKDANGVQHDLPAGSVVTYTVTPAEAATVGTTANADGSFPLTVSDTYSGPISVAAAFTYPDGVSINFTPAQDVVAAPEDVTGDVVIS